MHEGYLSDPMDKGSEIEKSDRYQSPPNKLAVAFAPSATEKHEYHHNLMNRVNS